MSPDSTYNLAGKDSLLAPVPGKDPDWSNIFSTDRNRSQLPLTSDSSHYSHGQISLFLLTHVSRRAVGMSALLESLSEASVKSFQCYCIKHVILTGVIMVGALNERKNLIVFAEPDVDPDGSLYICP
jgi:hypothetical protein